ncbi:uncharacterized protein LOC134693232 isoform X2 [Mytilus trossulus]|uniref:uncharacterized protein LOC134693232 isoform X2 n=1 Tax=Mytilus trossulus TaxID=6551 RepID=UPI003005B364
MPRIGRRRNGNGRVRVPVVEAQPPERRRGRRNRAVAAPRNQDVGAIVGEVQVQAPLPLQIQAPPLPIERQPALQGPVAPAMNVQAPFAQVEIPAPVPMPNQNGEINNDPMLIPNQSECDVYVSQNLKEKIWNREFIDLSLLLYQNFISQVDRPQNVISYDNAAGSLVITSNKNSKVKSIQNIESWTDAFINYMKIFIQRFPNLASELTTYMSIIRGTQVSFEKIYCYDQQFRLRMANNPTRSWSSIDGILWYTVIANGEPEGNTIQQTSVACLSNEIWIIGSSIICSARDHSENRPSGSNLGLLKNNNCFLRWAGKSGMKWDDVVGTVNSIINLCNKIPHALILHCGGNDIGNVPCGALLYHVKFTIAILSRMLPNCSLIWSSILPRRSWRYSSDDHAMEVTRKRINRGVRSYILKHGGYVIKYPDFDDRHPALYSDDGVHLSFIGNDIFLNQIQSALETFIKYPHCVVFPHDHL